MIVLSSAPERWGKVYALSRRVGGKGGEGGEVRKNVKYLAMDFLNSPKEISRGLGSGGVERVQVFSDLVFTYVKMAENPEG